MARTFGGKGDDDEEERDDVNDGKKLKPRKPIPLPPTPTLEEQEQVPAPPLTEPEEEIRNEAEEGQHLYINFVLTEIARLGLRVPSAERQLEEADGAILNHLAPERFLDWGRAGRELRQVADAFARSKERECVRRRAQSVRLESIDFSNFLQLLQELFQGEGITRERIMVLFFFCADVAIEAIRRGFNSTFGNLMEWSLKYISTNVAQWVHRHGGWTAVLGSSLAALYQMTACCACIAVVIACAVYIRRNI